MTNLFLQVNKDLYKLGLNANEQLILSYILEFQTKNMVCFITDETFAEYLGTSKPTVSRVLNKLETKGYIARKTENVKGGKKRYITVNINRIDEELAGNKHQNDVCKTEESTNLKMIGDKHQFDSCTSINLIGVNNQNDSIKYNIKDNIKEKEKDNVVFFGQDQEQKEEELAEEGSKPTPAAQTTSNPADLPLFYLLFPSVRLEDLVSMGKARQVENNVYELTKIDGSKILVRER